MGPEPVYPEASYWKVKQMGVEGKQTCPPPGSGPYLGLLVLYAGVPAGVSTAVTGVGLGSAVVQLAGAVDYPGPREEARRSLRGAPCQGSQRP